MKIYYDNQRYYPYLCIKEASDEQLKQIVSLLKKAKLDPKKFYSNPKYSASDGNNYSYMFKLPFIDDTRTKPDLKSINDLMNIFVSKEEVPESKKGVIDKELVSILKSEKKYLSQIKSLLNSERIILETDKEFFREQLDKLGKLTKSLQQENNKIIDFFANISSKISDDINSLLNKQSLDSEDLKTLQTNIKRKEKLVDERELKVKSFEKELLKQQKDFEQYKNEQEKNYIERVDSLRALSIGVNATSNENEDSLKKIKILIIGDSKVNKSEIIRIFKETFEKNIELTIPNSSIIVPATQYDKIKNVNFLNYFKNDKFDYIILGPRPHSLKGVNLNKGPIALKKEYGLRATISIDNDNPLSKNGLEKLALNISKDWITKNTSP